MAICVAGPTESGGSEIVRRMPARASTTLVWASYHDEGCAVLDQSP